MNPKSLLIISLIASWCAANPSSALEVRVASPDGAPRILVDGQPVRARVFFGNPGARPLQVTVAEQQQTIEFVASNSATNATMHFRFGSEPGEIWLDEIQLTDLDEHRDAFPRCDFEGGSASFGRDWTFWPPIGPQNTVGTVEVQPGTGQNGSAALHVKQVAPADKHWPDFHVYHHPNFTMTKDHHYRLSFWIRASSERKLHIGFYRPGQTYVHLGGAPDVFESEIKLAAEVGVNFVSFSIGTPWPAPGKEVDWSEVDASCEKVLRANPKALLLPRIGMDPPAWWAQAHPDEVMQWEDGSRDHYGVPASPIYRHDAAERLSALVSHLEEKFGPHVAGYHPNGQNTGEWFYKDTWGPKLNGYAPADLVGWRLWLKTHYKTDEALRLAWKDSAVTCESAPVPTAAARHASPAGIFRDPVAERSLIDWADYQQTAMATCVCDLAHAVRTASHGRKLVLFFYGYLFEFGPVSTGPSVSGHYALRQVLNCPDIDIVCSPISYFDRGLGQGAPSMTAAESVALAGKMWLNEDDTHTYLATEKPPGWDQHVNTLTETNRELVRNVAQESIRNFATWWMDLCASGWFDDPGMWTEMARLRGLDAAMLKHPTPFRPEIAAVIDERSMLRVAAGGSQVTRLGVAGARAPLGRVGAPYGQYLMDDVMAGRVKAKLYTFLDAWSLSAADRAKLLHAIHGKTRIWCYAPGCFEENQLSTDAMRQLTGFELKPISKVQAWAEPTELGKKLGIEKGFGVKQPLRPLFAAADAKPEEILAAYPDGSAAVAIRRTGEGTSVFVGAPGLTSDLLRYVAREAGVHLFTETDCNVYATGRFLTLHASQDGDLIVNTAQSSPVVDLLTDLEIGRGPKLTLPMKRGETKVLGY